MESVLGLVAVVVVVALLLIMIMGTKIVRPHEQAVVETLGRYTTTLDSGLRFIVPVFQTLQKIDMRENVIDVPPQEVITKDNVVVTVDAVVYLQVVDPFNFTYNIANFWAAITKLAQTNLRNLIGDMSLDESLVSRDTINTQLRIVLDEATDKWGTKVTRVEIQRIEPPRDVAEAMHRQMKAERDRRAKILEAEGAKRSAILVAEGDKESQIRRAEGEAEAIRQVAEATRYEKERIAEGEAVAVKTVFDAIHAGAPTQEIIALKYLESLQQIAEGTATKIFLPFEASGILGSLGAIGGIFDKEVKQS